MANKDMEEVPRRRERWAASWMLKLDWSLGFMKSAARRSTKAIYINIPADAELKTPSTISAFGLFSLYTPDTPTPIAIPIGVVKENNIAIMALDLDLNFAYIHTSHTNIC